MMPCGPLAMPDRFQTFEVILRKRGRKWRWYICTTEGMVIMQGSEGNRTAAKYQADRALFLLLLTAPYRLRACQSSTANNLQQSWRFDWEPPKAVLKDVRTIDWILGR